MSTSTKTPPPAALHGDAEDGYPVAHQFEDIEQQFQSDTIGMWAFLITEVLFFGGLFLGYAVYRASYPEAWAEGSHHMDRVFGTINTAVLLLSSLSMALAVHAAEERKRKATVGFLLATIGMAFVFLGIKAYEYWSHIHHHLLPGEGFEGPPAVELFFGFYFTMTGLHGLHVIIGIGVLAVITFMTWRGRFSNHMPVEMTGLYWHFVDIVWIFLFPLFYLIA